jgi:predicted fused transcriptional regulator/phosphomethylpyrimidine kinase
MNVRYSRNAINYKDTDGIKVVRVDLEPHQQTEN